LCTINDWLETFLNAFISTPPFCNPNSSLDQALRIIGVANNLSSPSAIVPMMLVFG